MYNASQYFAIPRLIKNYKLQIKVVNVTDEQSPNERFSLLIDQLGFTQLALSQRIGLSQAYISQLASGSRQITVKLLQKIAKKLPSINVGWVLTGHGQMFLTSSPLDDDKFEEPVAVYEKAGEPLELLRLWMEGFEARIKELEAEVKRMKDEKG